MDPAQLKPSVDPEELRRKLKVKHLQVKSEFENKHKEASDFLKGKNVDLGKIRQHSAKLITAGALAGGLALSSPSGSTLALLPPPNEILARHGLSDSTPIPAVSKAIRMRDSIREILPDNIRPLTQQEEKYLERVIEELTGVPAKATLEGEHLNTTYGKIGAEQHLRRYPGDVNENHLPEPDDYGGDRPQEILKEGMAPGLGAWGYFANSKAELTPELEETERWYAVVQTLYLPDWNTRQPYLKDWYKYRKVMIVNTDNGKAVVASIADSGPAAFTGKHFGGSPEVMDYLGGERYKKGPVILFFVDDRNNEVPLGPVEYSEV
jgi:hypothetical protein